MAELDFIKKIFRFRKCRLAKFWGIRQKNCLSINAQYTSRYVPFHVLMLNRKVKALYWTVQIEENRGSLKVKELSLRDSPLQSTTFKQHGFIFYAF